MASSDRKDKVNLLLMCTGSVASIKIPELCSKLLSTDKFSIRLVPTEKSLHFFTPSSLPPGVQVFTDSDEWSSWQGRGDPVLHIELRKWADVGLVAPMDANTLAKAAGGLCDNLLTCCLRAWEFHPVPKPVLFCPAMNTQMWLHPVTGKQVELLTSWGFTLVPCVEKTLVCGDSGFGAMAHLETIVEKTLDASKSTDSARRLGIAGKDVSCLVSSPSCETR
jgi:phosphopantothenoylcysteine decarboxylase